MKTIEEYEVEARTILAKRYPPMTAYYTSEITDTITQLVLKDVIEAAQEMMYRFSFDHDGCLCVKVEEHS